MKGHGLMQAIARVKRVFRDRPAGLVVDYIGVAQNLKNALGVYSPGDRDQTGIDEAEAIRTLLEKYEIVRAMFRPNSKGGFDYRSALHANAAPQARTRRHGWSDRLGADATAPGGGQGGHDEGKKRAHRRYADAVTGLSRGFALAGASDEAQAIRDEVGFFQAIQAALAKERTWGRQEDCRRPRAGDPADHQPRGGLDRNRRYHEGDGSPEP